MLGAGIEGVGRKGVNDEGSISTTKQEHKYLNYTIMYNYERRPSSDQM